MRVSGITAIALIAIGAATSNAQEPNFGRALAATQTELFIGQPVNWYGPGAVYTYRRNSAGEWTQQSRLFAGDSARMDDFGRALAVDRNTLIVGAPRKRGGGGVAYVFERANANAAWRQSGVIALPAAGSRAQFASTLALSGDELLIGAPGADSTGAVYSYRRMGGEWRYHDAIRPVDVARNASFGAALSRQGEWLLIGAPAADSTAGRVYASRRGADGTWSAPTKVALAAPAEGARIGSAVLIAGSRAFVGAPGAASVFVLNRERGDSWSTSATLPSPDSARGSQLGAAIAAVGNEVWVGAPGVRAGNGRVFRFRMQGDAWQPAVALDADSANGRHWPFAFGYAIAAAGDGAVVSMPQRDFGEGRVLVATRSGNEWRARQILEGEIFRIGRNVTPGARCENGRVAEFTCNNIQVVAHIPTSALGGERGAWVNDVWGWTDPQTQREYALVARRDGASFVDVTDASRPRLIGNLPRTVGSPPSVWRDIKVIGNHAFIVADGAAAHGMQVFDLTRLRNVRDSAQLFTPDHTYRNIASAHNVVADTISGFVYIVGANGGGETCGGGLHMVDVRNATNPTFAGCYLSALPGGRVRGYTHDAQCLVYRGPDTRYQGRQICVASNEAEINIADVTDKSKPVTLGRNSYPNVAYAHQGWFDDEQRYFYMNDELDELEGHVKGTRTIVWDLSKLDEPLVAREYIGPVPASDHNLFVRGNLVYEANYGSGLRVLDISNRTNPREIGFFDSAPYNQDEPGHSATASGAWSNYPFFRSGNVLFTSVREGLFIIRVMNRPPVSD